MSASPDEQESTRHYGDASASEIEAVANELVDLVEEFEAKISGGHVPAAFAKRLAELRQTAQRLIAP
jgi:dihydroneopterin aldolase